MNGSISQSGFWIRIFSVVTQQERLASRLKTWGKHSKKKNRIRHKPGKNFFCA